MSSPLRDPKPSARVRRGGDALPSMMAVASCAWLRHARRRDPLRGRFWIVGILKQGFECGNRGNPSDPDRGDEQVAKFAFRELFDGKLGNHIGIFSAQRAAGLFDLLDHLALARFEVGEAFSVGHLGHVHRPFDGLPAAPNIG